MNTRSPAQSLQPSDYWLKHAINIVRQTYGHIVSVDDKAKDLIKFGRYDALDGTELTLQYHGGLFDPPAGNLVTKFKSSDAADDQLCIIEGHTIAGDVLTFVSQTKALDGTNDVTLDTPLHDVTRLENENSTDFAGLISVLQDDNTIRLQTDGTNNQSLKCASAVSKDDYLFIFGFLPFVNRQNDRSVDMKFQTKNIGKTWKTKLPFSVHSNSGSVPIPCLPYIIVPPNTYFRVNGIASGASTGAGCSIFSVLGKIIGSVD